MMENQPFNILTLFGGMIFLWFFVFWIYRDYCIDAFRDKIFTLRDDLFDAAASGLIDFDHPAYGLLRKTMNGLLRFGHKISFFELFVYGFVFRKNLPRRVSFSSRWEEATRQLDNTTKAKMSQFRDRMAALIVIQAVIGSPLILCILFIPLLVARLPIAIMRDAKRFAVKTLAGKMKKSINSLESVALATGKAC